MTFSLILTATMLLGRPVTHRADLFLTGFLLVSAVDLFGWTTPLVPSSILPMLDLRRPLAFLEMPLLLAYVLTQSLGHFDRCARKRALGRAQAAETRYGWHQARPRQPGVV